MQVAGCALVNPSATRRAPVAGIPGGSVIGKTDREGGAPTDAEYFPQDVAATVYHHLGIDARAVTFADNLGRPTPLIESGQPIRELVR